MERFHSHRPEFSEPLAQNGILDTDLSKALWESFEEYQDSLMQGMQLLSMRRFCSIEDIVALEILIHDRFSLEQALLDGFVMQEELKISNESMWEFYQVAEQHLSNQQALQAVNSFLFLCFLNPEVASFWTGLGHSERALGKLENATMAYAMALEMDPCELEPSLLAIRCLVDMKKNSQALELFEMILGKAQEDALRHADFITRAQKLSKELALS